jgi:hypothetical protein
MLTKALNEGNYVLDRKSLIGPGSPEVNQLDYLTSRLQLRVTAGADICRFRP